MSLSAISTSGIIMGSGSVAISGELYVRASQISGGIPASTVAVWSTPTEISVGNIENYAMTGSMIRLSTSMPTGCSIGGIDAYGYYADRLLMNVHPSGSGSITLKHESTNSLAYNRFSFSGGSGLTIHPYLSSSGCMVRVIYDPVSSRWLASIPMWYPERSTFCESIEGVCSPNTISGNNISYSSAETYYLDYNPECLPIATLVTIPAGVYTYSVEENLYYEIVGNVLGRKEYWNLQAFATASQLPPELIVTTIGEGITFYTTLTITYDPY